MINTLIGIKKGMTSSYDSRGRRVGATVVELGPNLVTQVRDLEKDKYQAVQLGFGTKKSIKKPQIGHLKKAGIEKNIRFFKEVRIKNQLSNIKHQENQVQNSADGLQLGQEITAKEIFAVGDEVKITGVSKGKGFQGGVRRHGFHGGPKTHGQSDRHRAPGSIGSGTTPGRVLKGKKMAGHMGVQQVSYKGVEVIAINKNDNLVTIKGGVPGPIGGLVIIEKLGRIKGYTPPPEEKPSDDESFAEATDSKESVEGKEEEGIQKDSENSANQNISGSEKSDKTDSSETQSNSDMSGVKGESSSAEASEDKQNGG